MRTLTILIAFICTSSLSAQSFQYFLNILEDTDQLQILLINTDAASFNYAQISSYGVSIGTGAANLTTVDAANSLPNTTITVNTVNMTTAYDVPGTIQANGSDTLRVATINLVSGTYTAADFTIDPGAIPPLAPSIFFDGNGFSPSIGATLPITITSFTATKLSETSARLAWETSLEINSDYFVVQRSQDLRNWESLGQVDAAGNSDTPLQYSFDDLSIPRTLRTGRAVFYYRLVAVDLDEAYDISEVRGLSFDPASSVIRVYPNPTDRDVVVDLTSIDGGADIQVLNMDGQLIFDQSISDDYNDIPVLDLKERGLTSGTYLIRVVETVSNQVHVKKVILLD